jgi:hypothetical protein
MGLSWLARQHAVAFCAAAARPHRSIIASLLFLLGSCGDKSPLRDAFSQHKAPALLQLNFVCSRAFLNYRIACVCVRESARDATEITRLSSPAAAAEREREKCHGEEKSSGKPPPPCTTPYSIPDALANVRITSTRTSRCSVKESVLT